jgi:hypothetical protein
MEYIQKLSLEIKSCFSEIKIDKEQYFCIKICTPLKLNTKLLSHLQKISFFFYVDRKDKIFLCFKNTEFEFKKKYNLTSPQKICSFISCYVSFLCPKEIILCRVCCLKKTSISLYTFLYIQLLKNYTNWLKENNIDTSLTEFELESQYTIPKTKQVFGALYKNNQEIVKTPKEFETAQMI